MATLLLTVGASVLTAGSAAWVTTLVTAAATVAGSYIDARLFGPGPQKQEGPRLDNLQVQASTEGAPIPEIAGRVRLSGQVIWATKFKEVAKTETSGGGGKGGGGTTVQTTTYTYYANFAVGLCEGVIDRIGRVWADGKQLDMKGVTMRLHRGGPGQSPDPLIEGKEGSDNTPAYRGTAYVAFENLQITQFGNRLPQLSFEVFRRVSPSDGSGLEDIVQAITLIPGAGERVYDTEIHTRDLGGGASMPENEFAGQDTADWNVALDDLQASIPNASTVLLVVGWFGDDLRAANCTVRPKVEVSNKTTTPNAWKVHTLTRGSALVVSTVDGRPAYGGTPSDDSVVRAIRDLKARGFSVVFYPFVFMDIAQGNALPDPWTGNVGQPVYPWRGRITCDPAPGRPGTADKTSAATGQIDSFFGTAAPADIAISVNGSTGAVSTSYSGPDEWSFRRFILHYAKLCAVINAVDAGAVDAFLIGSELRSLTTVRDSATNFPAVGKLATLAADVKSILGAGVKVGYAADWSEYNNYNPGDGSSDLFFHLDPLWADGNVDFVGVDLYVPLSDWRDGNAHLDALAGAASIYDLDYLRGNVEGGEDYDWYYADANARDVQDRSAIADGAYGKPWVYRAKDFRSWWLNQHFDRPAGVESGSPSGWTPQSKPIWFTELGIPSVDKGTNEPNVFYDPKSSESLLPHYSRGTRDDLIQRRGIEAALTYWAANNPVSSVYGGPMVGLLAVWTWDARPYCMYLDKPMRDHVLLQAIARVNRPYVDAEGVRKRVGLVVDFVGVLRELRKALQFDSSDVSGVIEDLDVLLADFQEKMAAAVKDYLDAGEGGDPDERLERVVYGRFLEPEARKAFFEAYKDIEALWEILSPSPELRDHIESYKRLAQLYAAVRNAYAEKVGFVADLAYKTKRLVEQSATQEGLGRLTKAVTFDVKTLEALRNEKGSDEGKVFNLVRGLQKEIDDDPNAAAVLQPLKDRAERILKDLEDRKTTGLAAMDLLAALAAEKDAAAKAAKETGLSPRAFGVFWALRDDAALKSAGIAPLDLAKETEKLMARFPNARVNADEQRQFRAALYRPLLAVGREERTKIVDLIVEIVTQ